MSYRDFVSVRAETHVPRTRDLSSFLASPNEIASSSQPVKQKTKQKRMESETEKVQSYS